MSSEAGWIPFERLGEAAIVASCRLSFERKGKAMPNFGDSRRFNHFAMPSETHLRTVLLAGTIFAICWSIGFYFTEVIWASWSHATPIRYIDLTTHDVLQDQGSPSTSISVESTASTLRRLQDVEARITSPAERPRVIHELDQLAIASQTAFKQALPHFLIPLSFGLTSLAAIALVYLTHGIRIRRKLTEADTASPLTSEIHFATQNLIDETRTLEGSRFCKAFSHLKTLVMVGHRSEGLTYGLPSRYTIALSNSLGLVLRRDLREKGKPYRFRALILHELAHIVNRDIGQAFWARASWLILVPLAIAEALTLPFLELRLRGATTYSTEIPKILFLQVLVAVLVVELMRRGLLRNREHYADLRAAYFWDAGIPLGAILASDQTHPEATARPARSTTRILIALLDSLKRSWSLHPSHEERKTILDNPALLFRVANQLPLLAGLLFGYLTVLIVINSGLLTVVSGAMIQGQVAQATMAMITSGSPGAISFYLYGGTLLIGSTLVVALYGLLFCSTYFLVGTIGAQIQTETLAQAAGFDGAKHPFFSLLRPAVVTAAGIEIGHSLVPNMVLVSGPPTGLEGSLLWLAFGTLSLWLWMATTRLLSRRLLASHIGSDPPTSRRRILQPILMLLLWLALLPPLALRLSYWQGVSAITPGIVLGIFTCSLAAFVALFSVSTFLIGAIRLWTENWRDSHCPSCGASVDKPSVRSSCAHCGARLALWLLTPMRYVEMTP